MAPLDHWKKNLGFLAGMLTGATGGYAAKPQRVEIPPPPPVVANGWRCVQSGIVDPATGRAQEWCTLVEEVAPLAPPAVDAGADPRIRCELSSTGQETCIPLEADAGE